MARARKARGRKLRDRVPVSLRQHGKSLAVVCAGLAVTLIAFGDVRVSPYVTSASRAEADLITEDVRGTVGLYDTSVAHSIQLEYDEDAFDRMMKEFEEEGTKDYIKADLTIDGVHLEDVGIRLKGNSTLMSLRGDDARGGARGRMFGPDGQEDQQERQDQGGQDGGQEPQDQDGQDAGATNGAGGTAQEALAEEGDTPQDGGAAQEAPQQGRGGGMTMYELSPDKPEELPWLIKIDEYIEGRAYQGEREISVRPGSDGQVPLNEALSLSLTDASGEPAERYAFSAVQVNNGPAVTRLMVENPDTDYAESTGDGGGNAVLYKARAGGSFAYRGDDPTDYEESFRQLNLKGSQDLSPVMRLAKWAEEASDEEFAEELGTYVDVESFARYVATQNLLLNFDDMAGPGNNYLLRYDLDTKKFSVLGWDYNLSMSGDTAAGPDDELRMGGGMGGGPGRAGGDAAGEEGTGNGDTTGNGDARETGPGAGAQQDGGGFPGGPGGAARDNAWPPGEGAAGESDGDGEAGEAGERPQGMRGGHVLKERFLELDAFDEVYKDAYRELYETFYGSGTALRNLEEIAEQARNAEADGEDLDSAVTRLRTTVTERTTALAGDEEVTG
ncbi:CotH kinase family protein [Streptomyces zingiberis]|uniref:Spore coat protein CotH n=1 Tax=Streptomyces zingiberis TaxID=2053010 RepID=A0ABX1BY94_9ACTN|nr:CotH kinase family protein [Streptomyces zingiberis]NJQ02601.1 spore coat protein CotH [Streptomyces zingiberis]